MSKRKSKPPLFKTDVIIADTVGGNAMLVALMSHDTAKSKAAQDAAAEFIGRAVVERWMEKAKEEWDGI
jgi:hypothetical protein